MLDARGVVPRSVHITVPGEGVELELGKDFTVDRDAGTVIRVPGGNVQPTSTTPCATSRWRVALVGRRSFRHRHRRLPGSRATFYPGGADVVPAATRRITQTANRVEVDHDGRVLRVLLERPWFSSGEDERLAVVLDQNPPGVPERTRWDAIHSSHSAATPDAGRPTSLLPSKGSEGSVDVPPTRCGSRDPPVVRPL